MKYSVLRICFIVAAVLCILGFLLSLVSGYDSIAAFIADLTASAVRTLVCFTLAHIMRRWEDYDFDREVERYEERVKENREASDE